MAADSRNATVQRLIRAFGAVQDVSLIGARGDGWLTNDERLLVIEALKAFPSAIASPKAAEAIESLKKQIAELTSDDESLWPACILGTDEAQAIVDSFIPSATALPEAACALKHAEDHDLALETRSASAPGATPSQETLIEHATLLANGGLLAKSEIAWRAKVLAKAFLAQSANVTPRCPRCHLRLDGCSDPWCVGISKPQVTSPRVARRCSKCGGCETQNMPGSCDCAEPRFVTPSATATSKLPQEDDTYWAFQYSDGSWWTDDIFGTREQAERFAKGLDSDLVEGATLREIVIRPTDSTIKEKP